ncbi:ataxin-7-like protein 3 isoform X1 [Haliotis rubra]|uniref:ataxin-7-like protein 3 isoform X1 n=1 Tax=Haliotis rubra TaxID=36100 RepID=UPI001EE6362C|nr:ataxin-7-like protein 3 isoform X1 [Haliotis rubra]
MVEADLPFLDEDEMLQAAMNDVMLDLIDEVTLGLCFEVHRATKRGTIFLSDTDPQAHKDHEVVDRPGVDVFGQVPTKKQFECVCPNCQRHLAASRFAPHLEKCMGMGRNSSRIASRRIANNSTKRDSGDDSGDDDNDNDWTYIESAKKSKKPSKKEKSVNSPRRNKSQVGKVKNGGDSNTESIGTPESNSLNYESMTIEERKSLLLLTCGVISEHTKKMCTRSSRCPQHTDDQRSKVRQLLLRQGSSLEGEDVHVDIDSIDDAENQVLRETLQWEASSNSSPADSTSTNNSTGSRKRSQKSSSKSGGNKKRKTGKSSANNGGSNTSSSANLYDFS